MLGSCLGQVVEIDADALQRRRVDAVWVQLHCKSVSDLPRIVELDVDNIRFNVLVVVGEESTSLFVFFCDDNRSSRHSVETPQHLLRQFRDFEFLKRSRKQTMYGNFEANAENPLGVTDLQ